jgi:hypothetical protein
LRFAVSVTAHGFSIHTIGLILLIVGIIGLVISVSWLMGTDRRGGVATATRRDGTVLRDPNLP